MPDATEGDIQKATVIGALGIIVPMVDTVEKIGNEITFPMYPPVGKRSQGGGQYGTLCGRGYRQLANDNIMIVALAATGAAARAPRHAAATPEGRIMA